MLLPKSCWLAASGRLSAVDAFNQGCDRRFSGGEDLLELPVFVPSSDVLECEIFTNGLVLTAMLAEVASVVLVVLIRVDVLTGDWDFAGCIPRANSEAFE